VCSLYTGLGQKILLRAGCENRTRTFYLEGRQATITSIPHGALSVSDASAHHKLILQPRASEGFGAFERAVGLEPTTFSLARRRSTTELCPHTRFSSHESLGTCLTAYVSWPEDVLERDEGIEPSYQAWKASVLPLN
jgi:hypothetical protein